MFRKLAVLISFVFVIGCQSTEQSLKVGEKQKVVRTAPKYPIDALNRGITGFVKMKFDVATNGKTKNIIVVNSQPKVIFDESAVIALSQWTYIPKIVNDHPVEMKGLTVTLSFGQ